MKTKAHEISKSINIDSESQNQSETDNLQKNRKKIQFLEGRHLLHRTDVTWVALCTAGFETNARPLARGELKSIRASGYPT